MNNFVYMFVLLCFHIFLSIRGHGEVLSQFSFNLYLCYCEQVRTFRLNGDL